MSLPSTEWPEHGYNAFANKTDDPEYEEIRAYLASRGKYFGAEEKATNTHFQYIVEGDGEFHKNWLTWSATYYKKHDRVPRFNRKAKTIDRTPRRVQCYCAKGTAHGSPPTRWWTNFEGIDQAWVDAAHEEYWTRWHAPNHIDGAPPPAQRRRTVFQGMLDDLDTQYDVEGYTVTPLVPRRRINYHQAEAAVIAHYGASTQLHGTNIINRAIESLLLRYGDEAYRNIRRARHYDFVYNIRR